MSKSIRKILGHEQYELIKTRNRLMHYFDCAQIYGGDPMSKMTYERILKELNSKIDTFKLLRDALKQKDED